MTVVLDVDASTTPGTDVIGDTGAVTAVNEPDTDASNDSVTESTSVVAPAVPPEVVDVLISGQTWGLPAYSLPRR